jgi:hypothetical protein
MSDGPYSAVWATAISAGPANESSQQLTFQVNSDQPSYFEVPPAIAPDGRLTFTLAAGVLNVPLQVHVSVTLQDDGGTANGGHDSSPERTLVITLLPEGYSGGIFLPVIQR